MSATRLHHIDVLIRILGLYEMEKELEKKEEKQSAEIKTPQPSQSYFSFSLITSTLSTLKTIADNVSDIATGNNTVNEKLDLLCDQVKQKIKACITPQDFIGLVYFLGEKSQEAQSLKRRTGQSRCCEIFHALRSYIVSFMQNDTGEYKKAYDDEINLLKNGPENQVGLEIPLGLQKLFKARISDVANRGTLVEKINNEINNTYCKLAYLEDPEAIAEGCRCSLLGQLITTREKEKEFASKKSVCHDSNIEAFPYCYQKNFDKIHYMDRYQTTMNVSYEEFVSDRYQPKYTNQNVSFALLPPPIKPPEQIVSSSNTHEQEKEKKHKPPTKTTNP